MIRAFPGMCTPILQHLSSNTAAICLYANQLVVEAVAQKVCPSIIYRTTFVRMCSSFCRLEFEDRSRIVCRNGVDFAHMVDAISRMPGIRMMRMAG